TFEEEVQPRFPIADNGELRALIDYWTHAFDWRRQEMAINRFAQFRAMVNGVGVHFVHERGVGDHPLPIILTHGYPDSFWRFSKIIPMLTHPEAHRADPADAFDVVGVTETIGSAFLPYADFVNAGALTLAVEAFRQWIGSTDA